jgi:hypothetical protein
LNRRKRLAGIYRTGVALPISIVFLASVLAVVSVFNALGRLSRAHA